MSYFYKTMKSPVGELKLVASDHGLAAILWENDDPKRVRLSPLVEDKNHPVLLETERQLNDYFAGKLEKFSVKLDFVGTEFQKKVWHALVAIPFGETRSYGQIARQIGNSVPPPLARAVATCLITALGIEPEQPKDPLELGDTNLLRMDMSEAARYWRVVVPIGKRDRKSGARKRKQEEIELTRLQMPAYAQ